jgi:hypothetical protein
MDADADAEVGAPPFLVARAIGYDNLVQIALV